MIVRIRHQLAALIPTVCEQVIASGFSFIFIAFLIRGMGLDAFGRFSVYWIAIFFNISLVHSALISPMMTRAQQFQAQREKYHSSLAILILMLSVVLALLSSIGIAAYQKYAGYSVSTYELAVFSLSSTLIILAEFVRRLLFADKRIFAALSVTTIRHVSSASLAALLFLYGHQMDPGTGLTLAALGAGIGIAYGFILTSWRSPEIRTIRLVWHDHWKLGRWLTPSALSSFVFENIYVLSIGFYMGNSVLGGWRTAQQLVGVINPVSIAIENFIPLKSAEILRSKGDQELRRFLIEHLLIWLAVVSIPLSILSFWAAELLEFLYGKDAAEYGFVVLLYAAVYTLIIIRAFLIIYFRVLQNTHYVFWHSTVTVGIAVAGSPFLLSIWGVGGAVAGILTSHILYVALLAGQARRLSASR